MHQSQRLNEIGSRPLIGTLADSHKPALAETTNGLYKTECVYGPDTSDRAGAGDHELASLPDLE